MDDPATRRFGRPERPRLCRLLRLRGEGRPLVVVLPEVRGLAGRRPAPSEADFVDDDLPAFEGADGCLECGHESATIDSVATTGDGLSRLFDLQNRSFEVVVCDRCGYTEFYRTPKRDDVILDLFFG